jgi:DNA replication protein DnaC
VGGYGKSHLAQAIGQEVIKAGLIVLHRSLFDLARDLTPDPQNPAESERTLQRYLRADLLILDDMGMKNLQPAARAHLLEIIMRRYEVRSTLMISNRPIDQWGTLLGDQPTATAILDRMLHRAEIIAINGRSHRLHQAATQATGGTAAAPTPSAPVTSPRVSPIIPQEPLTAPEPTTKPTAPADEPCEE